MSEAAKAPSENLGALIPVLGLCGFASTFTMRLIDPLVPTLAGEFGQGVHQIAFLVTAFASCYALGQPFLGPIADSVGKLRSIATCLAVLCVLSILAAFATSFWMLLGLRALGGVMAGGVIPAAMAAIGDRAPMAERQIMLGRFLVIMIVGQMAGATFSGLVADHIGWRAVLGIAGLLEAGLAIGAMGLGGLVYGILTRILVERVGPRQMMRVGGLAVALSYFAFTIPGPWWSAIGIFLVTGFGFFLMHGTFQAQATELAPTARGSAMALFACFFFMGHATGPLIMGALLHLLGPQMALVVFGVVIGTLGVVTPRLLPPLGTRT